MRESRSSGILYALLWGSHCFLRGPEVVESKGRSSDFVHKNVSLSIYIAEFVSYFHVGYLYLCCGSQWVWF